MSEQINPKCPNPSCDSINFKCEVNKYVGDVNGEILQFVFCKECGTTVGVLPYSPKK